MYEDKRRLIQKKTGFIVTQSNNENQLIVFHLSLSADSHRSYVYSRNKLFFFFIYAYRVRSTISRAFIRLDVSFNNLINIAICGALYMTFVPFYLFYLDKSNVPKIF